MNTSQRKAKKATNRKKIVAQKKRVHQMEWFAECTPTDMLADIIEDYEAHLEILSGQLKIMKHDILALGMPNGK